MESIEFLNYEFLDNSLRDYFYFIVAFVFGAILIIPVKAFISKVLIKLSGKESDGNDIKKYNSLLKKPLQYFLLLIVLYFSVNFLNLPDFMISKEGSGVNFEGPAPRPLERFRIALADDGQIIVDKTKIYQQEKGQWADPEAFLKV